MLNLKDENRRYNRNFEDDNKTICTNSLERESSNPHHLLYDSNIIKEKIINNRMMKKSTLPRNSLLNSKGSPANSKDKILSIYSPVSNHTKSPSLPVLSSNIYKFKARNIKANDKTIGDANLIRQQKEKDLDDRNILVFDMATRGETGFGIHKSISPTINEMISQSFTPYIPKIDHYEEKYKSRK